jgi:hypothetical protein
MTLMLRLFHSLYGRVAKTRRKTTTTQPDFCLFKTLSKITRYLEYSKNWLPSTAGINATRVINR